MRTEGGKVEYGFGDNDEDDVEDGGVVFESSMLALVLL